MSSSLAFKIDVWNSVLIHETSLPTDSVSFELALAEAVQTWKKENRTAIWLKIPIEKSFLIPTATNLNFEFHHCKPRYVMLTLWLLEKENKLPPYATAFVGVGGFVVNEKKEVLVVKEKVGPAVNIWKIPGGGANPGEDIWKGAIREVFEETGIKTEFVSLLCFRQHNGGDFGKTDLYFVCLLKPLTHDIKIQEDEISDCKWMPVEEFMKIGPYKGLYKTILELGKAGSDGAYQGWKTRALPIVFIKGENYLYHGCNDDLLDLSYAHL
eukprot:TRINITY_DN6149_c0_g2_i1.p1 TRINITY_DN6149_c0_g2~~TRINITY_DN6149_c0_g2_i1.p1  ORF type:complete len:268 (+),score=49.91 TRINITY_DN6149_c0_g2_i1:57-860(+)